MSTADLALEIALLALRDADARDVERAAKAAEKYNRPEIAKQLRDMLNTREI